MAREGVVSVDGIDYRLYRESSFGDFVLEHAGSVIARATKPSAFRREFVISTRNNLHVASTVVQSNLHRPRRLNRNRVDCSGEVVHPHGERRSTGQLALPAQVVRDVVDHHSVEAGRGIG